MKVLMEQNTPEWHEYRSSRIGGSDLPIILGISPYKTRYRLWCEKMGLSYPDVMHPGILRGQEREPIMREYACRITGYRFFPEVHVHKEHDWAIASLDGIFDEEGLITTLECKYNNKERHSEAKEGVVCDAHMYQMQWGLSVSGGDVCVYISENEGDFAYINVERNDEMIAKLWREATLFKKLLDEGVPPEKVKKDCDLIEITDEEALCKASELVIILENEKRLKDELKLLEAEKKAKMEELKEFGDDGSFACGGVVLQRVDQPGRVDYKALCKGLEITQDEQNKYKKAGYSYWQAKIRDEQ